MSESAGNHQKGPMPMEFEAEGGLRLRALQPADAERIFAILQSDTDIRNHYVTWLAGAESVDDIAQRITKFNETKALRYGIFSSDDMVGYVGAFRPGGSGSGGSEFEMGYFCDPNYRGQGIVTRAVHALMKELEEKAQATSFALYIADQNEPSQGVAANLGFTRTDQTKFDELLQMEERRYERQATTA